MALADWGLRRLRRDAYAPGDARGAAARSAHPQRMGSTSWRAVGDAAPGAAPTWQPCPAQSRLLRPPRRAANVRRLWRAGRARPWGAAVRCLRAPGGAGRSAAAGAAASPGRVKRLVWPLLVAGALLGIVAQVGMCQVHRH